MSFKFVPSDCPGELINHCDFVQYPYELYTLQNFPNNSWYLCGVTFFDHQHDQFNNIDPLVIQALREQRIKVLFYYHEGDDPSKIKQQLDHLCQLHQLPSDCYRFVSGNTQASKLAGFVYFADHELLFQRQNNQIPAVEFHDRPRTKQFTALSRTHKHWRATVMSDLVRKNILNNSYWSYRTDVAVDNDINPLSLSMFPGLEQHTENFLQGSPYVCDDLDIDQQNNHKIAWQQHHDNAYCNIVLETFFDIDNSGGTFLSEKTFKPIKNAQPFVIAGPQGTLQCLRDLGYRTFDHAIDNSYDLEPDHSQRWFKLVTAINRIKKHNMHDWYIMCKSDILHNQQLFLTSKYNRLNMLHKQLLK
jgi:hypothetical protein